MKTPRAPVTEEIYDPIPQFNPSDYRQPRPPRRSRGAQPGQRSRGAQPCHRSRGAQPGNLNALKHGFYARQFKKADLTDLEACQFTGLNDEITMLRVYLRRLIELGQDVDNFPDMLGLMRVLCLASSSLTRLLKAQRFLGSGKDEWAQAVQQVIADINAEIEMKKKERLENPTANLAEFPPRTS